MSCKIFTDVPQFNIITVNRRSAQLQQLQTETRAQLSCRCEMLASFWRWNLLTDADHMCLDRWTLTVCLHRLMVWWRRDLHVCCSAIVTVWVQLTKRTYSPQQGSVGALYPNKKARYRKRIARSWGTVSYFWCKFSVKIIILIYPVAELYRLSSRWTAAYLWHEADVVGL